VRGPTGAKRKRQLRERERERERERGREEKERRVGEKREEKYASEYARVTKRRGTIIIAP